MTNLVAREDFQGESGWQYYAFDVSSDAVQVNFSTFDADGDVDLYVSQGQPLPFPRGFGLASTNTGLTGELIEVFDGAMIEPLTNGVWYVGVYNRDTNDVNYTVCVREIRLGTELLTLTNAVPFTNTTTSFNCGPYAAIDYYYYEVSTNAVRAQFEIFDADGNVDLVLRRGLPLPNDQDYDYASTNLMLNDELIVLFTNSTPVALAPGDWYVGVINRETNAVNYTVQAREYDQLGTNVYISNFLLASNSLCMVISNTLPGVHYQIQGTVNLTPIVWVPVSPTLTALTNSLTYCVPLASSYSFFRVLEGQAQSFAAGFESMTLSNNGFLLQWLAPTNLVFNVQWSPQVPAQVWNTFTNSVTSTNDQFEFLDDGSQTGGLEPQRFYRLIVQP
jgi:hypothetical protein